MADLTYSQRLLTARIIDSIIPLLKLYKHAARAGQVITESEAAPINCISDVGQRRHFGADVEQQNTTRTSNPVRCNLHQ